MSVKTVACMSLLVLAALGGCDKSMDSGTKETPASAASNPAEAPAPAEKPPEPVPAAATEPKPAPAEAPRMAEYTPTADDKIGTKPDNLGLAAGKTIPDAKLRDIQGNEVTLSSLNQKGPLLVVFYRGGWCPYCNAQIRRLSEAYGEFEKRGVTPVLISVDKPDEAAKTNATYKIPFPVLSDSDLAAHEGFQVVFEADQEMIERLNSHGVDLEEHSGKDHHKYAVPSIFLVDDKGVIRWAHVDPDYKVRPKIEQLVAVLDKHGFPAK